MKAITIPKFGGPDVLEVRDYPDPEAAAGEVRVRVEAAGLNFAEVMARKGLYPDAPKTPCVVGYEAAGTIDQVGDDVTDLKVGDRVAVLTRFGGHADLICVPEIQAVPIPESMDFKTAAAIPVVYLTAYHMLFHVGHLKDGNSILVHMAAGGVGTAAIQLCRTLNDVTIYGTASPGKHDFIREQGCTHPIDYRNKDYEDEILRLTRGQGVDMVIDALGGKDWRKGYRLLKPAGHLAAFGFANAAQGETRNLLVLLRELVQIPFYTPMGLMNDNKTVSGVNMGHLWEHVELLRTEIDALMALYEAGKINPHIDSEFSFANAADAHRRIESRKNVGKVVLIP